jgi:bifunctional non-homologous end joining protein LigD
MPRAAPSAASKRKSASAAEGARSSAKGDLSRYRDMRDFSKTPEPSGAGMLAPSPALRFVIQKHAARRLHYDLRLELDGVYKSWAVAKGPSLDPQVKRLAVHVEDHPIDYGDFEGVIPQGEYGGGTVMIWDRGFWRPEGDPAKGYAKGHLAFELDGDKLRGRWHLIRTKPRPGQKKEQWLLFKSDDAFAHADDDILEESPDSVASRRGMDEIASDEAAVWSSRGGLVKGELSPASVAPPHPNPPTLGEGVRPQPLQHRSLSHPHPLADADDPKWQARQGELARERDRVRGDALNPASIRGAKTAPFPGFIEPCLALLAETPPSGDGWLHEIKFDGYRLMVLVDAKGARLMTRSGLDWTARFPAIADAFADFPAKSAIVDGEAVVEDENGVSSFSALQEALSERKAASGAVFFAFDLLYLDGYSLLEAALDDRKDALATLLAEGRHSALRYSEHVVGEGPAMFGHACRLGLEGIVGKRRTAPYRSGRHREWVKCKCTNREEFVVGGYAPSTATRNAIGSLALGAYDGGKLIHAGRTGTGFTQKSAEALFKALQPLRKASSPFADALSPEERRGLVFVEPSLVAEVEFRGWTQDRHLRHASFKGLREDKPASEVRLEMPRETASGRDAPSSRKKAQPAAKPSRSGEVEFAGVRLTHPDRILWAGQGLTKLGLAEYYAEAADFILPYITGRPLALVRCPNGSEGDCFYQKHSFAGLTDAVEIAHVPEKDGEAETMAIHDLRGLITLVQASVLEIHPWGARIEDLDHPDTMIFDLDPGEGLDWSAVVDAAREVRSRLSDRGVESYVKTSGGKGLHVVTPLAPRLDWDELKAFAHGIALAMERDAPSKYVSTMAKKARGGKIFVDYLRNGRGATAVAAYSTRARPGAPVSTPVHWDELGPAVTPARFTVANIGRRLAAIGADDPWEGFFTRPQRIAGAQSGASPTSRARSKPRGSNT